MQRKWVDMWFSDGVVQHSIGQWPKQTWLLGALGRDANFRKRKLTCFEQGSGVTWGKAWTLGPDWPGFKSHTITNCVTLGKILNLSVFSFLTYKMRVITAPSPWEYVRHKISIKYGIRPYCKSLTVWLIELRILIPWFQYYSKNWFLMESYSCHLIKVWRHFDPGNPPVFSPL